MLLVVDCDFVCHQAASSTFAPMYRHNNPGLDEIDVLFKFLKMLKGYCFEYEADNVALCWDSRQSKRRRIFSGYKDRNKEEYTPEEIVRRKSVRWQMKHLRTCVLPEIGFTNNFHQIGHEGDDVMASVVLGHDSEEKILMITADKDMLQLLSFCDMYSPASKRYYTEESFVKEYGIKPSQWKSVKQIGGCRSDTVPGVEGVAEGRALSFVSGDMKETSKFYGKILAAKDLIKRNALLVNLPFPGTKEFRVKPNNFDLQNFMQVCKRYGFNSYLDELEEWEELFYERLS